MRSCREITDQTGSVPLALVFACFVAASGLISQHHRPVIPLSASVLEVRPGRTTQLDEDKAVVVPLEYAPPGRPLLTVQGRINDAGGVRLLVGTALTASVQLLPEAAKQFGIAATGETINLGLGPAHKSTGFSLPLRALPPAGTFQINVTDGAIGDVPVMSMYPGPPVSGVLGGALFTAVTSRFDFARKQVEFYSEPHSVLGVAPGIIRVPMVKIGESPLPAVEVTLPGGERLPCLINTATTNTILPARLGGKLSVLARGKEGFHTGVGQQVEQVIIESVTLGGSKVRFVPASLISTAENGELGLDFLSRFRVTLDPRNRWALFEPRRSAPRLIAGEAGFAMEESDGKTFIAQVARKSAEQAGFRRGDQLRAIDGQSVDGMSPLEVLWRTNGIAGSVANLVIRRNGAADRTVRFVRRSHLSDIVFSPKGFAAAFGKDRKLKIVDVLPNSEAAKARLSTNELIAKVEGRTAANLTSDELWTIFSKALSTGKLKLTLREPPAKVMRTIIL